MRAVTRPLRRLWAEVRISGRRRKVAQALQAHFRLAEKPALKRGGGRGHDSIYTVSYHGKVLGILRLVNPYTKRPPPAPGMPFRTEEGKRRIDREWLSYTKGAIAGLTPKPLWHSDDALLCEYVAGRSLHEFLLEDPEKSWDLLAQAAGALRQLHLAGLTHMDASLANMLLDEKGRHLFIDFEYAPAEGVSFAAQRVYDHLRLAESTWKFIPDSARQNYKVWLDVVSASLDEEMRGVELAPLAPALCRILDAPLLGPEIRRLFR